MDLRFPSTKFFLVKVANINLSQGTSLRQFLEMLFYVLKLLSQLSVHKVNHLLCKNRMSSLKIFSSKKLFKNVTLHILHFILVC